MASFFPLYFKDIGYSGELYGLQNALLPLVALFSNYIWSILSDKLSRIKLLLIGLNMMSLLSVAVMFVMKSPLGVMAAMLTYQFFAAPVAVLVESFIMLKSRSLKISYASLRSAGAAGYSFAALIVGVALAYIAGFEPIGWMFLLFMALALISLIPVSDPRRSAKASEPVERVSMKEAWPLFRKPQVMLFLMVNCLCGMAMVMSDQYLSFLLVELGGTSLHNGLAWMIPAGIEVVVFILIGRLGSGFHPLFMLALGAFLFAVRSLLIIFTMNLAVLLFSQVILGIAIAIYLSYTAQYMIQLIPDRYRSTGQAVMSMFMSVFAATLGAVLGSFLFSNVDIKAVFIANCVLLVLASICFLGLHIQDRRRSIQSHDQSMTL
ncbi:MFS transporter [Paenibacillus sp. N3/727]|uniref:MFS transporter n=1 Tax=Paenibacillus sp. N3/727 TaxID=2925845 RepID=UPI001F535664|nr:MFS transporter [Paenibacillus sp. N3/727]UNK18220.1 MFS transporter [Paenibacillus sp. N3/727]